MPGVPPGSLRNSVSPWDLDDVFSKQCDSIGFSLLCEAAGSCKLLIIKGALGTWVGRAERFCLGRDARRMLPAIRGESGCEHQWSEERDMGHFSAGRRTCQFIILWVIHSNVGGRGGRHARPTPPKPHDAASASSKRKNGN